MIIGLSIGGILLLLLIAIVIAAVVFLKRRKAGDIEQHASSGMSLSSSFLLLNFLLF